MDLIILLGLFIGFMLILTMIIAFWPIIIIIAVLTIIYNTFGMIGFIVFVGVFWAFSEQEQE